MSNIPNNDEIINELTEDLERHCTPIDGGENNIPEATNPSNQSTAGQDDEKLNLTEFDNDCDEESPTTSCKPDVPDDYIDEEELKEKESSLSKEELDANHEKSIALKSIGNKQFKDGEYFESIQTYTDALKLCPLRYQGDRAIFYCNRSASKLKLQRNEAAVDDCSKAIELNPGYQRAYLRRATTYQTLDKLDEALADFKKLLELDPNQSEAREAVHRLPPLIQERNEKLKDEMLGKLKDLGNMFLKPFGLSTNNFKLQPNDSGGYSVNFQQ